LPFNLRRFENNKINKTFFKNISTIYLAGTITIYHSTEHEFSYYVKKAGRNDLSMITASLFGCIDDFYIVLI
jgi:hypothetical protein